MIKKVFVSLIGFFCLFSTFAEAQDEKGLSYDQEQNRLVFGLWALPSWLDSVLDPNNPDTSYHFLPPSLYAASLTRGWQPAEQKPNYSSYFDKNSMTPSGQQLKSGWFYSPSQPSSVPSDWIYSPTFSLFSNQTGLEKLTRFFRYYSGSIPRLIPSVLNKVKLGGFVRLLVSPDPEIAYVDLDLPHSLVLAYRKILPIGSGMMLFILYALKEGKDTSQPLSTPQFIKGNIVHKDGKKFPFLYKAELLP